MHRMNRYSYCTSTVSMRPSISMQMLRCIYTSLVCLLFVFGTSVCTAEAADLLPESDCCPSSQEQAPKPSQPETICCQLAQPYFITSERGCNVLEKSVNSTFNLHPHLINNEHFTTLVETLRTNPFPLPPRLYYSFDSDHLRNTRNPRAPSQAYLRTS